MGRGNAAQQLTIPFAGNPRWAARRSPRPNRCAAAGRHRRTASRLGQAQAGLSAPYAASVPARTKSGPSSQFPTDAFPPQLSIREAFRPHGHSRAARREEGDRNPFPGKQPPSLPRRQAPARSGKAGGTARSAAFRHLFSIGRKAARTARRPDKQSPAALTASSLSDGSRHRLRSLYPRIIWSNPERYTQAGSERQA